METARERNRTTRGRRGCGRPLPPVVYVFDQRHPTQGAVMNRGLIGTIIGILVIIILVIVILQLT